jgi:sensor histidine kinase YesM
MKRNKIIIHSLILIISCAVIFLFETIDNLSLFSLQLSGLLLLTLIISHRLLKPESFKLAESTVSTMAVLLVCNATGGLSSPLFFLNYLLLFELSVLLEPFIPYTLSLCFVIFYFLTSPVVIKPFNYLEFTAFFFMTPFATMVGSFYMKIRNQKNEIKQLSHKIHELEDELVEKELNKNDSN